MPAVLTLLRRSLQSFGADKCATLAAAIAYHTVFALFPMALLGVSLLGFFMGDVSARRQVVDGIASVITLGDAGKDSLSHTLAGVSLAKGWLGLFGLLTGIWGASGLFGSLRSAMDSVWDVDRPLPFLRAKVHDLTLFVGFGGLLLVSTMSTGLLQRARQAGAQGPQPVQNLAGPLGALLALLLPLLFSFAAFLLLYRFTPHARLHWRHVWPAAAIMAMTFDLGKDVLTFYLRHLTSFNALAGSLGAAILFLAFVYYASQAMLFFAEFAKHRLLVEAGVVPATDTQAESTPRSLPEKGMGILVRLWRVGHDHHDTALPYAPGRMDPATNSPTNTREEVLFKRDEGRTNAARDSGKEIKPTVS
jgi:membrane protein